MPSYPFMQVDAFTTTPLQGNPCAIVFDADDLSDDMRLAIAREMNLSETSFVVRSDVADFGARYFTPAEEIPLAGHPTIATVFALIDAGRLRSKTTDAHATAVAPSPRPKDPVDAARRALVGLDHHHVDPERAAVVCRREVLAVRVFVHAQHVARIDDSGCSIVDLELDHRIALIIVREDPAVLVRIREHDPIHRELFGGVSATVGELEQHVAGAARDRGAGRQIELLLEAERACTGGGKDQTS